MGKKDLLITSCNFFRRLYALCAMPAFWYGFVLSSIALDYCQYLCIKMNGLVTYVTMFAIQCNWNIRGGEWSFKNSGSCKILVEFHESRSIVFQRLCVRLAVSIFIRSCLQVSIFRKAKGVQSPDSFLYLRFYK